jgi:prepilin-type N-terminal cleavage/methylation domain-containing protein
MRRSATTAGRAGFTLVELIIVIGIIVLLAGLLLQAIVKVRDAARRAYTRNEIGQLEIGVENFKHTYDVKYVPTAIILCSDYAAAAQAYPTWAPALQDSQQYLSRIWPKANFKNAPPPALPNPFPPNTLITLDGNQTITFFLGGVPPGGDPSPQKYRFPSAWQGNRSGFLNSPVNPFNRDVNTNLCMSPPTGAEAKGPFYDFKPDRVDDFGHALDPDKWPYYYFSSKNGNDYGFFGIYQPALNPNNEAWGFTTKSGYGGVPPSTPLPSGGTSPPLVIPPMHPLVGLDGKFVNPNGFQIISAGRDNLPGPGGWDSINNVPLRFEPGIGDYSPGARGGDDIANFARGPLGGNE